MINLPYRLHVYYTVNGKVSNQTDLVYRTEALNGLVDGLLDDWAGRHNFQPLFSEFKWWRLRPTATVALRARNVRTNTRG